MKGARRTEGRRSQEKQEESQREHQAPGKKQWRRPVLSASPKAAAAKSRTRWGSVALLERKGPTVVSVTSFGGKWTQVRKQWEEASLQERRKQENAVTEAELLGIKGWQEGAG